MRKKRIVIILLILLVILLCLGVVTVWFFSTKSFLDPSDTKALTDKIESIAENKGYETKTTSLVRKCRRGLFNANEYNYFVEITNDEFDDNHKYVFEIITTDFLHFSFLDDSSFDFHLFGDKNTNVDFSLFEDVVNSVFEDKISSDDLKAFYADFIEEIEEESGSINDYEKSKVFFA